MQSKQKRMLALGIALAVFSGCSFASDNVATATNTGQALTQNTQIMPIPRGGDQLPPSNPTFSNNRPSGNSGVMQPPANRAYRPQLPHTPTSQLPRHPKSRMPTLPTPPGFGNKPALPIDTPQPPRLFDRIGTPTCMMYPSCNPNTPPMPPRFAAPNLSNGGNTGNGDLSGRVQLPPGMNAGGVSPMPLVTLPTSPVVGGPSNSEGSSGGNTGNGDLSGRVQLHPGMNAGVLSPMPLVDLPTIQ